MNPILASTVEHLRALVAFDTQNPPREIGTDGIFDYLRSQLLGFQWTTTNHGGGSVSFFAVRGNPRILFNVHLDTVPAAPHGHVIHSPWGWPPIAPSASAPATSRARPRPC